ncbi:hypothetical protein CKM354_000210200 [Cercospora kikuchii]|uniref:Uncharacterized protein n=1 Tax=Cercospora kikuchii TaxID=84275 RepID=A0A9P3CEW0_9PEZI|nr:uncharacterized protein CKM354_000210200 [Cercospora kikuchii]GIZ38695.1 hypothetical protein CKM354_000210200 [Cercospora kikuchii]
MAPPTIRRRPNYNPFAFDKPVASHNESAASGSHKNVEASHRKPPRTPATSNPRPSTSSQVLRPTGAYPGQFAPLTKRTSLPLPGEMTLHAEENLRAAETREARRAAEREAERKARKEGKRVEDAEEREPEKKAVAVEGEKKKRCKAKTPKTPGLIQVLEMQSRVAGYEVSKTGELTYIPFTSRFVSTKVQRSRQQRQQELQVEKSPEKDVLDVDEKTVQGGEKKKSIFPFLHLPETVKVRIYKLLVIETRLCIWPATKAGREQPDISMACKEIRNSVLPIYYGENTFAIDIAPPIVPIVVKKTGSAPAREPLTGLAAVRRWAELLSAKQNENGKWFGLVNNWCFSYGDPVRGFSGRATVPGTLEGNRDFIVYVQIVPKRNSTVDDGEAGGVSKTARAGPIVEVHREAACIMPGWSDCGKCVVQTTPEVLVLAIRNWLRSDRAASEGLEELVLEMRKMNGGLPAACCTKMPHSGQRPVVPQ